MTAFSLADGRSLDDLLGALCTDREVFSSSRTDDGREHLVRSQGWPRGGSLGRLRPVEPIKAIFFRPREHLGLVPLEALTRARTDDDSPPEIARVAVGVKNCDLASLPLHDHVFRDSPPVDPGYADARARTLVISSDCTDCLDVCFCTAVGQQPWAREGFDIDVAPVGDGDYVVQAGSERGEAALAEVASMLQPADDALLRRRDEQRAALRDRVAEQTAVAGLSPDQDFQAAIRDSDDAMWRRIATRCVECGACNFACCTCHCFLIADGVDADGRPARTKQWDACLFYGFAKVAGGNAREDRASRLRNRFEKKFDFFKDRLGHYACDGCGRCTEVCIAHIDIREVLREAAQGGGA